MRSDSGNAIHELRARLKDDGRDYSTRVEWPDESNRSGRDIDALAYNSSLESIAIEHVRIEGLPRHEQKETSLERFATLVEILPSAFFIRVEIPQVALIDKRMRTEGPEELAQVLRGWLPPPRDGEFVLRVDSLGFEVNVTVDTEWPPGVRVVAYHEGNQGDNRALVESIEYALTHKAAEIERYKSNGSRSILLMQLGDFTSSSPRAIKSQIATAQAAGKLAHLDEIWLARGKDGHIQVLNRLL